ncbi:YhcH/YjgK/YiaL family protein [Clostridium moniliforme]|uniref:YhcH/YjgK/YiaL family protein n=1 Tax=Clostridium moniliforme TaxID=39489 RepID=A0ABS4F3L4_9CLOT|nr:YhcH/YjgK/YiaL family protein [Clostridium moniliforme]MBP1890687.1 YhcH/YjgK/YiaL family protein [Clostridium moniliforme]
MIFGNLKDLESYNYLHELVKKALRHALENNVIEYEAGSHEIEGDKLFLNRVNYTTKDKKDRFWEGHKKYIDVHVVFEGKERINLNFKENLKFKEYVEKDDFLSFEGDENSSVVLEKGDFLICYPADIHMTCLKADENSDNVKKAIYKVIL